MNHSNDILGEQVLNSSIKSRKTSNTIDFILDSGAATHTCYINELINNLEPSNTISKWGNTSTTLQAQDIGDSSLRFTN